MAEVTERFTCTAESCPNYERTYTVALEVRGHDDETMPAVRPPRPICGYCGASMVEEDSE